MNSDTDVLEFDFPDYEEPYPPFPDVKVALFDKEDSYSKNRDIADRLYENELEKEKRRIKKLRKAVWKKRKRASRSKKHPLRRIFSIIALFFAVEASVLFVSLGGVGALADYIESIRSGTASLPQAAASEKPYVPAKPFEQDDAGEYDTIYTTDEMSFMFMPSASNNAITVGVWARNLTEEKYWIMCDNFYLTDGEQTVTDYKVISYTHETARYTISDEKYYKNAAPIAFGFNRTGRTGFYLEFSLTQFEENGQILSIGYDSQHYLGPFIENTPDDFEVPFLIYD